MTTIFPILHNDFIQFNILFTSSEGDFAALGKCFRQQIWYYTILHQAQIPCLSVYIKDQSNLIERQAIDNIQWKYLQDYK